MYAHLVDAWCSQWPEDDTESPETRITMIVNCHVDARNQTQVVCKSDSALNFINAISPNPNVDFLSGMQY